MCDYNDRGWCYAPESVDNTNAEWGGCYNPKECKANTSINIVNVGTKGHCDYKHLEIIKLQRLDLDSYGLSTLGDKWFDVKESESDIYWTISNFVEQYNRVVFLGEELKEEFNL